jgi:hypothetical protein
MRHQFIFVYIDRKNASLFINHQKSLSIVIPSSREEGGIRQSSSSQKSGLQNFIQRAEPELSHYKHHSVFGTNMDENWEITRKLGVDLEICLLFKFSLAFLRRRNFGYNEP